MTRPIREFVSRFTGSKLLARARGALSSLLKGGRVFERIVLTLTNKGIAYQPLMNLLEVKGSIEGLKEVYSLLEGEPIMHFRIGVATKPPVISPRRPVTEVLP